MSRRARQSPRSCTRRQVDFLLLDDTKRAALNTLLGSTKDEAGAMPVVQFRALLAELIGVSSVAAAPEPTKAFAPAAPAHAQLAAKPRPAAKRKR